MTTTKREISPRVREAHRIAEAKRRARLTDTYVRSLIRKSLSYDGHPVTPEEVEQKRQQLIAWRTSRTCQCGAPTKLGASECTSCRRATARTDLADSYLRRSIVKQAKKAGQPIAPGQEIPATEIETRRPTILASRTAGNSRSGTPESGHFHMKKWSVELSDWYVRSLIKSAVGYDGHEITPEEIETHRQKVATGRAAGRPGTCRCGAPLKRHRLCAGCRKKAEREGLADTYVRRHIWRAESQQGLPRREIHPHEIEAVRQHLRAMREATPRR